MEKLKFWLLDINYKMEEGLPIIYLWGKDERSRTILVREEGFRPYIYLRLNEGANLDRVMEEVRKLSGEKNPILEVEPVKKSFFGKEVTVVKVTCTSPPMVPVLREEASRIEGVLEYLEADIRFTQRYLIDMDFFPCSWVEIKVEKREEKTIKKGKKEGEKKAGVKRSLNVDEIFVLLKPPEPLEEEESKRLDVPLLKVFVFDIETYNPRGTPSAEVDPAIIVGVLYSEESNGEEVGQVKLFTADKLDDKKVIKDFSKVLIDCDPDIIMTYNGNFFDWPYLLERAKKNKVKLIVGRDGSEPHASTYGHISVTGRGNVDLYDLARQLYEVKRKTLENVAEYLGVTKISERVEINKLDIWKFWDDEKKRETLLNYARDDVRSTYGVGEKFLPFALQMASVIGMPVDQVMSASTGSKVEQYLMHQAFKRNELAPTSKGRRHVSYAGGLVLKPKPGLHENVAVFDFSSMYPNIMIQYNISTDTYVPLGEEVSKEEVNVAPEVGHRFRKKPDGFYTEVIRHLLAVRKEIRDRMKKLDKKSLEYRLLENRQKAVKILANATYGYAGWSVARWYMKEVAEATSAWGRASIHRTIDIAKKLGLKVYYGDTDSVFLSHDKDKIEKFENAVEKELGLDIGVDKLFERVFFTEAKKRYCGLLEDDTIDVVGFETIRGDWTELAKKVQEKVIETVLREKSTEKAVKYVQEVLAKLDKEEIPFEDLIIWKTLTQKIDRYKARSAHIEVAKQLIEHDIEVHVGDKIGYVICRGEGEKLLEKAKPHQLAKPEDIDLKYYEEKQVIPAALRILKGFGVTEDELKTKKKQTSMEAFFKTEK